jgi:hypothetical protein
MLEKKLERPTTHAGISVFQVMTPYSLVNNTDVAEEHASCTYRLEE